MIALVTMICKVFMYNGRQVKKKRAFPYCDNYDWLRGMYVSYFPHCNERH